MDIITISITFPRENCALLQRLISYSFFIKFSYSVSFLFFCYQRILTIFFISLNKLIVLAEISDNIVFWVHWFGCDCVHDFFFVWTCVCELAFRYKFCSILSHFLLTVIFLLEWVCVCFFFVLFAVIIDYFRFFFSLLFHHKSCVYCLCFSTVAIVGFSHVFVCVCLCIVCVWVLFLLFFFYFLYYKLLISLWFVTYTLTIFFSCVLFSFFTFNLILFITLNVFLFCFKFYRLFLMLYVFLFD